MTRKKSKSKTAGLTPAPETKSQQSALRARQTSMSEVAIQHLPIDDIHMDLLIRDRMAERDVDLAGLMTSIKDIGLSNPIRVEARNEGGYELIQGSRRLRAFEILRNETGDEEWATIPALISEENTSVSGLYRQMVDENIVRKQLSFAEMAEAARNFAQDPATEADTVGEAVPLLFRSASYTKRSNIRTFARLFDQIGDCLRFPNEMPRNLGLALAREIDLRPELIDLIRENLATWDGRTLEDELDVLRIYARRDGFNLPLHKSKPARADGTSERQSKRKLLIDDCTVEWRMGKERIDIGLRTDWRDLSEDQVEAAIRAFIVAVAPNPIPAP